MDAGVVAGLGKSWFLLPILMKRMKKEQGVHSKNERLLQSQRNLLNECEILVLLSCPPRRRPRKRKREREAAGPRRRGGFNIALGILDTNQRGVEPANCSKFGHD